ncbi:hypothetical protein CEE44_04285 [Candidatus Woesearchaeota archaeon B3_Woes]|nr:MAG: hypothetical protein CEE44_04285 [Candidatus Woesearchaeota archaeon B3_Woes]
MLFKQGIIGAILGTVTLGTFYLMYPSNNLEKHVENPVITAPDQSKGIDKKEVDIYNFLNKYQSIIRWNAVKYGVPDTYLASIIASENYGRRRCDDLQDSVGDLLNLDVSLGPGQMTISTAASLDGITGELTPEQRELYEERLTNPETNIEYVARYLSYLKNRDNRFPDMTPEDFGTSLEAMAIVASEYMIGHTSTNRDSAQPNYYGCGVLVGMTDSYLQPLFDAPLLSEDNVRCFIESNPDILAQN